MTDTGFFSFIYLWLCWVLVAAHGFSLAAAGGSYSLVVVHWLPIGVASFVAEYRRGFQWLWYVDSGVPIQGL